MNCKCNVESVCKPTDESGISNDILVKLAPKGDDEMNGLMTEREWRRQYLQRRARPDWYGPQYVLNTSKCSAFRKDRSFHIFLLLLSVLIAFLLPAFIPMHEANFPQQMGSMEETSGISPRKVKAISYLRPTQLEWTEHTYSVQQLLQGKLLLLDHQHLLPPDILPPNTCSIASYGKGMVPVASLWVQSGRETINALQDLFLALEQKEIKGLMVYAGTLSPAQQRADQLRDLRKRMKTSSPAHALHATLQEMEWPNTGEMLQEYTVELRFRAQDGKMDTALFEKSPAGQTLLQLAWRYGFVRTHPEGSGSAPFRFRYVGKAHATAMTFLDLNFEDYLQLLHERGTIAIQEGGKPKYVISCVPVQGTHVKFSIPINAACEASLDNTGYAVVACTLQT